MTGRARRLARLEAMSQDVMRPRCSTVAYVYGPAEIAAGISLHDAIDAAVAAQAGYAQRCIALPSKMCVEDWIELAHANQIKG